MPFICPLLAPLRRFLSSSYTSLITQLNFSCPRLCPFRYVLVFPSRFYYRLRLAVYFFLFTTLHLLPYHPFYPASPFARGGVSSLSVPQLRPQVRPSVLFSATSSSTDFFFSGFLCGKLSLR